jgi:hypothetical protein
MHNNQEFELTVEERAALAALPREMDTGDLLEERVIRALRDKGTLPVARPRAGSTLSIAWKIAAAVTLFAGGVATGRYAVANGATGGSINAPATRGRDVGVTPRTDTRPVNKQRETVVAEREMWL